MTWPSGCWTWLSSLNPVLMLRYFAKGSRESTATHTRLIPIAWCAALVIMTMPLARTRRVWSFTFPTGPLGDKVVAQSEADNTGQGRLPGGEDPEQVSLAALPQALPLSQHRDRVLHRGRRPEPPPDHCDVRPSFSQHLGVGGCPVPGPPPRPRPAAHPMTTCPRLSPQFRSETITAVLSSGPLTLPRADLCAPGQDRVPPCLVQDRRRARSGHHPQRVTPDRTGLAVIVMPVVRTLCGTARWTGQPVGCRKRGVRVCDEVPRPAPPTR
jgi:hypothetical protein